MNWPLRIAGIATIAVVLYVLLFATDGTQDGIRPFEDRIRALFVTASAVIVIVVLFAAAHAIWGTP